MSELGEQAIFENQNILPAQFFPSRPDNARMEPLKRLAFAVLLDAVHVFQSNFGALRTSRRREFNEAREWLLGAPGQGPFSFENVCYLVDIDPSQLRNWLLTWQANKRAGVPCRMLTRRSPVNRPNPLRPRALRRRRNLASA
ncbi:MAG TPA: hypothetical protein VKB84_10575 [Candidatus Binataceae bacterium]|jgi:hypothetical protein|nr:hypothetical protein [Candidatus Binataceae bacterium]